MIATRNKKLPVKRSSKWQEPFLLLLPDIKRYADFAFRHWTPEAREDAVQEVIANAAVAFARLVELDKSDVAYPQALARFGIAQFREGRRVGNRNRINDVLSFYAQKNKQFAVESI